MLLFIYMLSFILLNLSVTIIFVVAIFEGFLLPTIQKVQSIRKNPPRAHLFSLLICGILLLIFVIIREHNFTRAYLLFSFGLLVLGHAIWLSLTRNNRMLFLNLLLGLLVFFYRIIYPSSTSHNILLFIALVWLGSFFTATRLLTLKRFIVISTIWFVYDFSYVWLIHLSHTIQKSTNSVGFPLALTVNKSSIGTADILWGILFLAILRTTKQKILGIFLLLVSNLLLGLYAYRIHALGDFPLLVLWVPLALLFLAISYWQNKKTFRN